MNILLLLLLFASGAIGGYLLAYVKIRRHGHTAPPTLQEIREMERERHRLEQFLQFDGFEHNP